MTASLLLLTLAGNVGLLLWGIHMVQSGVMRAFGSRLRRLLTERLGGRLPAFAAGFAVTTAWQSSTATALVATSFAADGLVRPVPALALMLGANVGSTMIVQLLSFPVWLAYPALLLAGVGAFRLARRSETRDIGRVAIGLGLVLLSLHLLAEALVPVEASRTVRLVLEDLAGEPLLNLLIAGVLAWAVHSSIAVMLFVMALAAAGILAPEAAAAMVVGANLGSAVNPVLSAMGGGPAKLRLPLGNLLTRLAGAAVALPLLGPLTGLLARIDGSPARLAANFHSGFNLALAAAFMGLLPSLAWLLRQLCPDRPEAAAVDAPAYLDSRALADPTVALGNAARETLRMADVVADMLAGTRALLHRDDRDGAQAVSRLDDRLDGLHAAVRAYLASVSHRPLTEAEAARLADLLAFAVNLEHAGDIIDRSLVALAAKRVKHKLVLSAPALAEIDEVFGRLDRQIQLAATVVITGDRAAARRLFREKEDLREVERRAALRRFAELRDRPDPAGGTMALEADLLRDLKRVAAHIAAVAYPLLERAGELRASRLAS